MEILYMGGYCEEECFNELSSCGLDVSHAAYQLEKNFILSLNQYYDTDKLNIISYIPYNRNNYIKCKIGRVKTNYLYCNKKSIFSIGKALLYNSINIFRWSKGKSNKIIIMYSVNPLHAIPAIILRRVLNYKVVTLSTEVSIYRRVNKKSLISKISYLISHIFDQSFDGYILLTEYMNEVINKKQKPYIVMEGIATEFSNIKDENQNKKRAIMYAGGLSADNGIDNLLNAFIEIDDKSCELWIYGDGECKENIIKYSLKDNRIKYFGLVSNDVIQEMESRALLLVNTRITKEKLFLYSFPSKVLEYMSSGTPVITTKLPGIPKEYYRYVYCFEDDTKEGLLKTLKQLLITNEDILRKKGYDAKVFVQNNKSHKIQGKRIIELLERIQYNDKNYTKRIK